MNDKLSADLASLRITRDEAPAPKRWWRWVLLVAALGGAAVAVRVWALPYAEGKIFKTEVATTEVSLVSPAQATVDLTATGYVVPQVVAKVGAKVVGRVSKVNVKEGQVVKAGEILFDLDPSDQKSAVAAGNARTAAARARAQTARAKVLVAKANVAEIQQQLDREKKLAASGAISQATVDDLAARVAALQETARAAEVEASAADAEANASQAEVNALQVNLGNMTIPAPIDGTATTKPAQVGDVVSVNATLVELTDFASLLVEVDVPEARMGVIKKGGPCEIVLDAFPDKRMRGEVVEVSPRLNRAKASGTVKVKFVDATNAPLPEMAARVSFLAKALDVAELKQPPKKVIPASAVVDRAGAKVAFVYEDGKAKMVTLSLGAPFAGGFELVDGPAPGTKLIKSPPPSLADGQPVKEKTDS
jgi:RND family efflux transporter MFP subunit